MAGIPFSFSTQSDSDFRPASGARPGYRIEPVSEKKGSNFKFTAVIAGAAVVIVAGVLYYLWPTVKGAVALGKGVALTAIICGEDSKLAIVDGKIVHEGDMAGSVKVIKIHKDKVEFEKGDKR